MDNIIEDVALLLGKRLNEEFYFWYIDEEARTKILGVGKFTDKGFSVKQKKKMGINEYTALWQLITGKAVIADYQKWIK